MVGEIDTATLRAQLGSDEPPLVVDIRAPDDFAGGHLPGSLNVPMAEIPGEIDEIAAADEVVTVCPHGKASIKAARIVEAYTEFDGAVASLAGGIEAWDGPLETDGESPDAPF